MPVVGIVFTVLLIALLTWARWGRRPTGRPDRRLIGANAKHRVSVERCATDARSVVLEEYDSGWSECSLTLREAQQLGRLLHDAGELALRLRR